MKKSLAVAAICLFLHTGFAIAECARSSISGAGSPLLTNGKFNAVLLDRSILAEANYQRCRAGLPALLPLDELRDPAQDHSNWMARKNKLSHKSTQRGRKTLRDRVNSTGFATRSAAENLAFLPLFDLSSRYRVLDRSSCRFASPEGKLLGPHSYQSFAINVVDMWLNSPGHKRNLMSKTVTHMAAAATLKADKKTCGNVYVTQLFVG